MASLFQAKNLRPRALGGGLQDWAVPWQRPVKHFIALWVAILSYALMAFLYGDVGLAAYNDLNAELSKQKANITALRRINGELEGIKNRLRYDEDTIRLYARELGYGLRDERFIRIDGMNKKTKSPLEVGTLVPIVKQAQTPDIILKIIACTAGLGALLLMEIAELLSPRD